MSDIQRAVIVLPQMVTLAAPRALTRPCTVELKRMRDAPEGTLMLPLTVVFDTHVMPDAVKPGVGLDVHGTV